MFPLLDLLLASDAVSMDTRLYLYFLWSRQVSKNFGFLLRHLDGCWWKDEWFEKLMCGWMDGGTDVLNFLNT
jgi:hypothetical protein